MQFRVLGGCCFAKVLFCESDGRVLGHAIWFVSEVLFCELDGRLQDWRPGARGMQFGVLVDAVLRAWRPGATGHPAWAAGGGAALRD